MSYSFDELEPEPQAQPLGGGRREPPRTGVMLEMPESPDYRWPQRSTTLRYQIGTAFALLSILGGLLLLIFRSLFR